MLYYDANAPTRGALAVPQGDFQTEISEEGYASLIESLQPQPSVEAQPNWEAFNAAITVDATMIAAETAAGAAHPSIVSKKDLAYSVIQNKGLANFAFAFPLFCEIAQVTNQTREAWAQLAESFDLPSQFVEIVRGAQEPE